MVIDRDEQAVGGEELANRFIRRTVPVIDRSRKPMTTLESSTTATLSQSLDRSPQAPSWYPGIRS